MLHKRIGLIFALFSAFSLVFNIFTPDNPEHLMNVIEQSCLVLVFTLSYFAPNPFAGVLQILALAATAFIPMHINDSPFFGAVISVFALVLIYAYGGYQSQAWWKLPTTFITLFVLCAIASSNFGPPSVLMYARAFGWTLFISVFCFVLWFIVDDIKLKYYLSMKTRIDQNLNELRDIKKTLGSEGNGTKETRNQ